MTRPRVTEAELQARLEAALAIKDPAERRRAANKARARIRQLEFRSTMGAGARIGLQSR